MRELRGKGGAALETRGGAPVTLAQAVGQPEGPAHGACARLTTLWLLASA